MARGSITKRCNVCRREGKTGYARCSHKEAAYVIYYRVGKRQKWETLGKNKKDAERLLAQRLSEINNGTYIKRKDIDFDEFAYKWLENCPKSRVKQSTFRGYTTDIRRHLNPVFKNYLLKDIDQESIEAFLSKKKEKLNAQTVNNIRLTLYMIMDYARKLKYIPSNPLLDVKPYKVEHKEMDFLNPKEIRILLKHAAAPMRTILFVAILTGMRRSEILALQWGDVDWNSNTIFVRRSIYWYSRKDIGKDEQRWKFISPKSKRSTRAIVMSPKLKEVLQLHRINAPINECDLIFANQEGNPVDADNMIKREFHSALSMAGLRRIRFHDLRHTYASLLIAQGENVKFIQSQLGHASIQTTMDRYGHLLPVDHVAVGSRVDEQVFGVVNQKLPSQEVPVNVSC